MKSRFLSYFNLHSSPVDTSTSISKPWNCWGFPSAKLPDDAKKPACRVWPSWALTRRPWISASQTVWCCLRPKMLGKRWENAGTIGMKWFKWRFTGIELRKIDGTCGLIGLQSFFLHRGAVVSLVRKSAMADFQDEGTRFSVEAIWNYEGVGSDLVEKLVDFVSIKGYRYTTVFAGFEPPKLIQGLIVPSPW